MSWIDCVVDNDYQIFDEEPYQIRRKSNKKIVSEHIDKTTGYIRCNLNQKPYLKHRIIALQFIPNPDNLPQVDHINKIRTDNRLDNLRWVNRSTNNKNRTSNNNYIYNYVDEISDNSIVIDEFEAHHFMNYYYDVDADKFYYHDVQYRELPIIDQQYRSLFVYAVDNDNKQRRITINRFKKLYNIPI